MLAAPASSAWLQTLAVLLTTGAVVAPREQITRELIGHQLVIDMASPVVAVKQRQLGYRFMCAEAAWILAGDNRLSTIEPYSKTIHKFSDDGVTFFGAYGPKIQAQLEATIFALINDGSTRQAVINLWHENPLASADLPCTLSYQFLIRRNQLHLIVTMRSNDVWLGLPYDIFSACMLASAVLLRLNDLTRRNLQLGCLYHTAGSRHLYEANWAQAQACIDDPTLDFDCIFDPCKFQCSQDLLDRLWALARLEKHGCQQALAKGVAPMLNLNNKIEPARPLEPYIERRPDGWYAVGNGLQVLASSQQDAQEIVDAWQAINSSAT